MIWLWRFLSGVEDRILESLSPMNEQWLKDIRRHGEDYNPESVGRKVEK